MKAGRKPNPLLTEKEMMVMKMLWEHVENPGSDDPFGQADLTH